MVDHGGRTTVKTPDRAMMCHEADHLRVFMLLVIVVLSIVASFDMIVLIAHLSEIRSRHENGLAKINA